jgi:hypothetical protein
MISPELEKMAASEDYKGISFCKVDVVSFGVGGLRAGSGSILGSGTGRGRWIIENEA